MYVESVAGEITPSQRHQKQLRTLCLERDQNRCVVSGYYDKLQLKNLPGDERRRVSGPKTWTEAAHIVPFSYGSFGKSGVSAHSQIQFLAN